MNNDLISREALRKAVNDFYDNSFEGIVSSDLIKYAQAVDDLIDNAPTAERPTGEWIYTDIEDKRKGYGGYCSICKCNMPIFMEDWKHKYCETSYCPNCGAKMKEGEEE